MLSSLILGEYFYITVVFAIAFCLHLNLIWKICTTPLRKQLSAQILINILSWALASFSGVIYGFYLGVVDSYSASWLFYSSLFYYSFGTSTSYTVGWLLFERIAILCWPTSYQEQQRRFIFWTILTTLSGTFFLFFGVLIVEPLPSNTVTTCKTFNCLLKAFSPVAVVLPKVIAEMFTVIFSFVFFYKLIQHQRQHFTTQRNFRQSNIVAMCACFSEFALNLIPFSIWTLITYMGINQFNLAGPYLVVLIATDGLMNGIIYHVMLTKKVTSNSVVSDNQPNSNR